MMHLPCLLALCLLSLGISALPAIRSSDSTGTVSLSFKKHLRSKTGTRTGRLRSRQGDLIEASLNNDVVDYYVDVNLGSASQTFQLLLDTGSSDIFVFDSSCSGDCPTNTFDTSTSTSFQSLPDLKDFSISYGDGSSVSGYYGSDELGIGNGIAPQIIGLATQASAEGTSFEDGIFGIGLDQDESIADKKKQKIYNGFISTLKANGLVTVASYSIFLNSNSPNDEATGTILFGGYKSSQFQGDLVFFPMVEKAPDGHYRLDVLEPMLTFNNGNGDVFVDKASSKYTVLLDTGSTICSIPEKQFKVISEAVGAQEADGGSYSVDCSLAQQPDGIVFAFSGDAGAVAVGVPWAEMVLAPGPDGRCGFGLEPESNSDAKGVYTLGDTFIRSAYLLFDLDNLVVGIAPAVYDH